MRIKVMLDEGAYKPIYAHDGDAGMDIRTPIDFTVGANNSAVVDTGVHIAIPYGYVGFLKAKSGLNVIHDIVGEGVVDAYYTGSIKVKLYNNNLFKDKHFKRGEKIIQLVVLPVELPELVVVDEFEKTERGTGGFGSTGK